ncbi:MAG: coproporphyrinogen III oxidase family protein [Nitrospirae bacterium]|nr:coproporphyrinogen III oxidase family protein [Nitrospirota bacterium]
MNSEAQAPMFPSPHAPAQPALSEQPFGVYIHIPFCVSKCSYCAFSSLSGAHHLMPSYLDGVHREIDAYARRELFAGRTASTLFFGGGTPSLAPPGAISALIAHCRRVFSLTSDAEITLEANPETVSYDRLRAFIDGGITRISLGVQSLDPHELVSLHRAHTADRAVRVFEQARRAGCANLNVDLIYGIPGQSAETWNDTVAAALALNPNHLSAYALTPETGTPFGTAIEDGRTSLPQDEDIEILEKILHDALRAGGFGRYEISNYARLGAAHRMPEPDDARFVPPVRPDFACRHNVLYWSCDDWLGVGASAHSHLDGHRWWNHFDPLDYLKAGQSEAWAAGQDSLDPPRRLAEALAFGVRMIEGVDGEKWHARLGLDLWERYGPTIERLIAMGLIEARRPVLRLTTQGLALADTVGAAFFEDLDS